MNNSYDSFKVSIIVPVYKVEKYIRHCIDSVLAQSFLNWELILVDDGSPDNCGSICDEYASRDGRIRVIHKKNGGLSSARNAALDSFPNGYYVTFLDSDDFWHKDYLTTLIKIGMDNDADIVQCGSVRGCELVFPNNVVKEQIGLYNNHSVFLSEAANIVMWGKLYRTYLFNDIRMPVGLYNEDDWTTWKLYYQAKTIVTTTKKLYYYTVNENSIMSSLKKKPDLRYFAAYDERISFFVKTNEIDLEHCSRLQLCKSLILVYGNSKLEKNDKEICKNKFIENWKHLKSSGYISGKYKAIFCMFSLTPHTTSKVVNFIYRLNK